MRVLEGKSVFSGIAIGKISILQKADVHWTSCTPGGRKGTFDGRYGCRKCFCVTFDKSNKTAVSGEYFFLYYSWQRYKFMCHVWHWF